MSEVKERIDKLEEALMRLVYIQQKTEIEIQNLKNEMKEFKEEIRNDTKALKGEMKLFKDEMLSFKNEMKSFKDEMLDFKNEMKVFKNEMLDFKNEMKVFKDEMLDFKNEMKAFKDEMLGFKNEMKVFKDEILDFKDEMKAFKDEMKLFKDEMLDFKEWSKQNIESLNKKWGELANKMGTLVEDIFAPSIEIVLKKYFDIEPDIVDTRKRIRHANETLELDILAVSDGSKKAFVVEAKSNPDRQDFIESFIKKLNKLQDFLPHLKDYTIYGIYAGLSMAPETVNKLSKKGIYAMVMKGDILEIVNFEKVKQTK